MYDTLSLTNWTLLTADMILLCTKTLCPIHGLPLSPYHRKMETEKYVLLIYFEQSVALSCSATYLFVFSYIRTPVSIARGEMQFGQM
jgi:hypothetical protein